MSHSSREDSPFMRELMKDQLKSEQEDLRKAIGSFPDGKLNEKDEGLMSYGITHTPETPNIEGRVIIEFAEPCKWMGMKPEQAMKMAEVLIHHAKAVSKEPLEIKF